MTLKNNISGFFRNIGTTLMQPADDCGLFPISARIAIYCVVLSSILGWQFGMNAQILISILGFLSVVMVVELMWKKSRAGKRLWWHFVVLAVLSLNLLFLLNQATRVREWWYRTNVLEKRIEDLILHAPQAIVVANGVGDIKYVNKRAATLIGYTTEELKGNRLTIIMRPEVIPRHLKAFNKEAKNLAKGTAKWIDMNDHVFRVVRHDGSLLKSRIYIVGIRYSDDSVNINDKESLGNDIEFYGIIIPDFPDELIPSEAEEVDYE